MDLTSLDLSEKLVLRALFELARRDHPARPEVIARVLDEDVDAVSVLLERLAARRLVDAGRVRLSLSGLAAAANVPALPASQLAFLPEPDAKAQPVFARAMLRLVGGERGSHR